MKSHSLLIVIFTPVMAAFILACNSQPATVVSPPSPTAISLTTRTDDTGVITVSLPSNWSDVDGAPVSTGSTKVPLLKASTSLRNLEILAAPGVSIQAARPVMAAEDFITALMDQTATFMFQSSCESLPEKPYYDRKYEGKKQIFSNCHNSGNAVMVLVIQPVDSDIVAQIILTSLSNQTSAKLEPILKSIMDSLELNGELLP